MSGQPGGLGRGLAAILTGPSLAGPEKTLYSRFVASALSSLSSASALSLCGYVYERDGNPDVTLRSPDLHSLHPTQAYQLFAAVSALMAMDPGRHPFMLGEVPAIGVFTQTASTKSLFFFGDDSLDETTTDRLASFCEIYAPILHDHDRPADETERFHLVLDQEGGTVHAEVAIGEYVGFGSAAHTHRAAALAAVSVRCAEAKLVDVGEVRAASGAAAFVVVAGDMGRVAMGAAPVAGGPDAAAALAALRAATVLAA